MKNWHRVMWGKMLWALFLPQVTRLCCQKWESWFCRGPLGRRYRTNSLGRGSSRNGSSTWENSLGVGREEVDVGEVKERDTDV